MVNPAAWWSVKPVSWLSVTPEPERELAPAVATLAHSGTPSEEAVAAEQARIERLVLRGSERAWLAYLHGVVELIDGSTRNPDAEVAQARALAAAVIANHHNLLLGLPGHGARLSATDRIRLTQLSADNPRPRGHT